MDYPITFIQIVDSSKLEGETRKKIQWELLENSIRTNLPVKESPIKNYKLFFASKKDFENDSECLTSIISEIRSATDPVSQD